jgi:hypothetical protein
MTTMNLDDLTLKLHLDAQGIVWYADGRGPPTNSEKTIAGFMLTPVFNKTTCVRLLGTQQNAHLVTALFACKLKNQFTSIEVGSPLICTAAQRTNPPRALLAMREERRAASLGGWHEVQVPEYHAYALISQMQKFKWKVDDHAKRLLKNHPVWKALSFIPHLCETSCCYLLSTIIDPRWYIDPRHPGRVSKLNAFLGLTPYVAQVHDARRDKPGLPYCRNEDRYETVLNCWNNGQPKGDALKLPENFLWRIHLLTANQSKADLRVSQVLVAFLRHTWLDALYAGKQHEPLFAPEHFFKRSTEVEAFKAHMTKQVVE